jgi:hypothetical protein
MISTVSAFGATAEEHGKHFFQENQSGKKPRYFAFGVGVELRPLGPARTFGDVAVKLIPF